MTPAQDARSVASAANALARALKNGTNATTAWDRLELHARRIVDDPALGFAPQAEPEDEELLAQALLHLEIGATLSAAERARAGHTAQLSVAAAEMTRTADVIENGDRVNTEARGFDSSSFTGSALDAARLALDEIPPRRAGWRPPCWTRRSSHCSTRCPRSYATCSATLRAAPLAEQDRAEIILACIVLHLR